MTVGESLNNVYGLFVSTRHLTVAVTVTVDYPKDQGDRRSPRP